MLADRNIERFSLAIRLINIKFVWWKRYKSAVWKGITRAPTRRRHFGEKPGETRSVGKIRDCTFFKIDTLDCVWLERGWNALWKAERSNDRSWDKNENLWLPFDSHLTRTLFQKMVIAKLSYRIEMEQVHSKISSVKCDLHLYVSFTIAFLRLADLRSKWSCRFSRYRRSNYAKLQRKRRIQKIAFAGIRRVTRLQSRLVTTYRPNTASERYNFFWTESFFTVTQASGVALISRREISRPSSRSKKRTISN